MVNEYPDFTAAHPEVPWAQMRGMRNRMAHGYFDINLDTLWETVQTSLPVSSSFLRPQPVFCELSIGALNNAEIKMETSMSHWRSTACRAVPAGMILALAGCATQLSATVPRDVDLSGEWHIDMNLSDYPSEAVPARAANSASTNSGGANGGAGAGAGAGGRGRGARRQSSTGSSAVAASPAHKFAMPPQLILSQQASDLSVRVTMEDGKSMRNDYHAGDKSVVNTNGGPVNRTVGWEHDAFVIDTELGDKSPKSEVRYFIDDDHMLEVVTTISRAGTNNFEYVLVYDRG